MMMRRSKNEGWYTALQGPVVRKPINVNLGLKFKPCLCLSCVKQFLLLISSGCLKATKVKT